MDAVELGIRFAFRNTEDPMNPTAEEVNDLAVSKWLHDGACAVVALTKPGREQSLAITHMEEALFWARATLDRQGAPPPAPAPVVVSSGEWTPTTEDAGGASDPKPASVDGCNAPSAIQTAPVIMEGGRMVTHTDFPFYDNRGCNVYHIHPMSDAEKVIEHAISEYRRTERHYFIIDHRGGEAA